MRKRKLEQRWREKGAGMNKKKYEENQETEEETGIRKGWT